MEVPSKIQGPGCNQKSARRKLKSSRVQFVLQFCRGSSRPGTRTCPLAFWPAWRPHHGWPGPEPRWRAWWGWSRPRFRWTERTADRVPPEEETPPPGWGSTGKNFLEGNVGLEKLLRNLATGPKTEITALATFCKENFFFFSHKTYALCVSQ